LHEIWYVQLESSLISKSYCDIFVGDRKS